MPPGSFYVKHVLLNDESLVRELLRSTPMQGAVHLALEREPNANIAANIEGERHNTVMVMNNADNHVLGMGSRSVRPLYVNGEVQSMGYLGQLRASPGRKGIRRLAAGYQGIEKTRQNHEVPFDLTSIISDNSIAVRMLERGLSGLPHYKACASLSTFLIPTRRVMKERLIKSKLTSINGAALEDIPAIATCLQNYLSQYQFAPFWDADTLTDQQRCYHLSPNDFIVDRKDGAISSCAAIWDQRAFKQVVIKGYSTIITKMRPLINILLSIVGKPQLPKAPSQLNLAYLSHLAVEENKPEIFKSLINEARKIAAKRGLDYLVLGLTNKHPLHAVLSLSFPSYQYTSTLYTVHWERAVEADNLQRRIVHVEVAIL